MSQKLASRLAWWLAALICAIIFTSIIIELAGRGPAENLLRLATDISWSLFPVVFSILAAYILSHQPRNLIGWLLMIPAVTMTLSVFTSGYLSAFPTAPQRVTLPILLSVMFSNWGWVLLIMPLLLIALFFPTGSPPSPRWRWIFWVSIGMCALFVFLGTFGQKMGPLEGPEWEIQNPIGFLSEKTILSIIFPWWLLTLALLTLACVASLFIRYRKSGPVEREQIKWLLHACGLFAVVYVPSLILQGLINEAMELLLGLSLLFIPISIAIAITRYRLWDIDLIIRRTLIYGTLTVTLALVYAGSVVVLQQVFQTLTGSANPSQLAIVVSTLAVAALFNPLRRRLQERIDWRFFRQKYDAVRILASFAETARQQTDLDALTGQLVEAVQSSLEPEQISVWLIPAHSRREVN